MAKIGVVTVTFNSGVVLDGFMQSILKQTHDDWILYVVDNDSKDNTLELLATYPQDKVKVIANKINYGIAKGNNQGIELALSDDCDFVLLLNNDTEFNVDLFNILLEDLITYKADIVSPKIMYFEPDSMIWCAGGGFKKLLGMQSYHVGYKERDIGQYNVIAQYDYVPTCCVLCKTDLFEKCSVGMMDEKYFVYYDDTDWMLRAKRNGSKLIYTPRATLYHKVSSLTTASSDFTLKMFILNRLFYTKKNFKGFYKYYSLVIAINFYLLAIPLQVIRGKWGLFRVKLVILSCCQGLVRK